MVRGVHVDYYTARGNLPHMVIIKACAEVKEQTANYQRQDLHLA